MELRPGYTMTELGVLPEDWELIPLSAVIKDLKSGVSVNSDIKNISNLYILKTSSVRNGKIILSEIKPVSYKDVKKVKCHLESDSIIISRMNTPELVGECGYSPTSSTYIFLPDRLWQTQASMRDTSFLWLTYLLTFDFYKKQIKELATGTSNSMKNITKEKFLSLVISSPPLPEQHAIAAALSDVDALLDAQERLIAKKRNIKLAAMQQLLTGKTRLPGFQQNGKYKQTELGLFPEDWCHTELNMIIANIIGGGTPRRANPQFWNGNIPWVTVKDFATFSPYRTQEYITKEGIRSSATHLIPAGTLLIATRMALGKSAIYAVDVAINQDLKALFFKDYIDTKFILYWFLWQESNIQALGSGSTVKGISLNLLKKINICCPPSLDEQRAIAAVLSDMDAELAALEARRDKLRAVKQGMMRELLTGRTRLAGAGGRHGQ